MSPFASFSGDPGAMGLRVSRFRAAAAAKVTLKLCYLSRALARLVWDWGLGFRV